MDECHPIAVLSTARVTFVHSKKNIIKNIGTWLTKCLLLKSKSFFLRSELFLHPALVFAGDDEDIVITSREHHVKLLYRYAVYLAKQFTSVNNAEVKEV